MKVFCELAVLLVVGALLVGCGSRSPEPDVLGPAAERPIDATYLVTSATDGGKPHELVKGSQVRLVFDVDSLTISAGCNTMSGLYSYDGSRLTVKDLAGTEMGCAQARMDQDAWLAGLFDKPVQLTTGTDAALISGDVVLALEDWKDKHPDPSLVGTNWVVDSIGEMDGDAGSVTSLEEGVVGYLRVERDGTVAVYDGCNEGSAKAVVGDEEITFRDRSSTLRGCTGGSVETLQSVFDQLLSGTATYFMDGGRLIIRRGAVSLHFRPVATLPAHD